MEETNEGKSLAIKPIMEIKDAQDAFKKFEDIKSKVLTEADKSNIKNKTYVNKNGWRKIKTMFGISQEILESRREEDKSLSGKVETVRWIYKVRVKARNGMYADAEASCDTKEDFSFLNKKEGTQKPENMIMAMAQTRAFNRAISDLVGGGETSVEDEAPANGAGEFGKDVPVPNVCNGCNKKITDKVKEFSIKKYKKTLCMDCQKVVDEGQK